MRTAVVAATPYHPPVNGERRRLRGLVEALLGFGEVTFVLLGWREEAAPGVRLVTLPPSPADFLGGVLAEARHGGPLALAPYVRRALPPFWAPFDLVVAYQLKAWRVARSLPARCRLLELTDALSLYRQRPEVPIVRRLLLAGVAREEREAASAFDHTFVSSAEDEQHLRTLGIRATVVPNAPLECRPLPRPGDPDLLLFVGDLRYPPNRQGVTRFLREIWPGLKGSFRLRLVGRGTEAFAGVEGVEALGFVEDLLPHYAASAAAVSPVSWGTGSQSKIWEALGYGRRVVVAAEAPGTYPASVRRAGWSVEEWRRAILWAIASGVEEELPTLSELFAQAIGALVCGT